MPLTSQAVVFYDSADPAANKLAPTGSLANSGWQYQFLWHGFSATPVAPRYFLSASHIGGGVGSPFTYMGENYTVTAVGPLYGADLRLFQVDKTFYSYAPMYDSVADGAEAGKNVVMMGRGGLRGTDVRVGNTPSGNLLGWNWATADGVLRWGENRVAGFSNTTSELALTFSRAGSNDYSGTNEAGLVGGDSGGGVFINVNGQWKLAGINYSVSGNYHYTAGGTGFVAALYDTRGLFTDGGMQITGGVDQPSYWFASRVGLPTTISSIKSTVNLPPTWSTDTSSNWGTSLNWANGTPANTAGAVADFRTVITANRTVTLSSGQTAGTIDFDNTHRYTLTGNTITLDTTSASINAQVNVASGSHTIASALTLNKNLDLRVIPAGSTLTLSGQMSAATRTINQVGLGTVEYKNVRAATLNVQQGKARILADGSTAGTSKLSNLSIPAAGSLDLTNNDLIISGGTAAGWSSLISSGRNGGAWNGSTGITSSTAAGTNKLTGLGVGMASDVLNFSSGTKTWSGQVVVPSDTLIKYTYVGDLDLDGMITGDDYFRIDSGYAAGKTTYAAGDLNYNGKVDGDDYFLMDWNYARKGSVVLGPIPAAPEGVAAVPEPAGLSLVATGIALLLRRSRSRIKPNI